VQARSALMRAHSRKWGPPRPRAMQIWLRRRKVHVLPGINSTASEARPGKEWCGASHLDSKRRSRPRMANLRPAGSRSCPDDQAPGPEDRRAWSR
jgi:hypothetical protein